MRGNVVEVGHIYEKTGAGAGILWDDGTAEIWFRTAMYRDCQSRWTSGVLAAVLANAAPAKRDSCVRVFFTEGARRALKEQIDALVAEYLRVGDEELISQGRRIRFELANLRPRNTTSRVASAAAERIRLAERGG